MGIRDRRNVLLLVLSCLLFIQIRPIILHHPNNLTVISILESQAPCADPPLSRSTAPCELYPCLFFLLRYFHSNRRANPCNSSTHKLLDRIIKMV